MEMLKERHRQYGGQCNVMLSGEEKVPQGQNLQHGFSLLSVPSLIQKEGSRCSQSPSS